MLSANMEDLSPDQRMSTGFFDLPLEIRREIYQYRLLRESCITFTGLFYRYLWENDRTAKNILLVSKRVNEEATDVLYGSNFFQVNAHKTGASALKLVTEANRRKIRTLQIVMRPRYVVFDRMRLDEELWVPLLAQLNRLFLVVPERQRRMICVGRNLAPMSKREWIEWVGPILEFIGRRLQENCDVEVDYGESGAVGALIAQYLPVSYRKKHNK
jgi:hypothetical protein